MRSLSALAAARWRISSTACSSKAASCSSSYGRNPVVSGCKEDEGMQCHSED